MSFKKLQRYIGLLFAVAFALVMLVPHAKTKVQATIDWSERTTVGKIIATFGWVKQLNRVVDYNANCAQAFERARVYKSSSLMTESILMDLDRLCDPSEVFFYRFDPVHGVGKVDSEMAALYQEYLVLNQNYRSVSKEIPPPDRLIEIKKRLMLVIDEEVPVYRERLDSYLIFNHVLVGFIFVLMVVFREAVGSILVLPLRMLFGFGKASAKAAVEIHRKV